MHIFVLYSETCEDFSKFKQLEDELTKVKLSLSDEKSKNHYLSSMIEKKRFQKLYHFIRKYTNINSNQFYIIFSNVK